MISLSNLLPARVAAPLCSFLLSAPHLYAQGGAGTPPIAVQPGAPAPQAALRLTPAGPLTLSPESFPRRLYVRNLSPDILSVALRFYESEPDTASPAVLVSPERLTSGLVLLATALLALDTLYFATPAFGTPRDYITAFLWGFGAKAGLEAVKTLADRLMSRSSLGGSGS